jgi:hypothetical protein
MSTGEIVTSAGGFLLVSAVGKCYNVEEVHDRRNNQ